MIIVALPTMARQRPSLRLLITISTRDHDLGVSLSTLHNAYTDTPSMAQVLYSVGPHNSDYRLHIFLE